MRHQCAVLGFPLGNGGKAFFESQRVLCRCLHTFISRVIQLRDEHGEDLFLLLVRKFANLLLDCGKWPGHGGERISHPAGWQRRYLQQSAENRKCA